MWCVDFGLAKFVEDPPSDDPDDLASDSKRERSNSNAKKVGNQIKKVISFLGKKKDHSPKTPAASPTISSVSDLDRTEPKGILNTLLLMYPMFANFEG